MPRSLRHVRRPFGMTGPDHSFWNQAPTVTYACPRCGASRLLGPSPDPRTRRYPQHLPAYCPDCHGETPHRLRGEGDLREKGG